MAEVVHAHLHLEAVEGERSGQPHHTRVVAEHVEVIEPVMELSGAVLDRGEARQVEGHELEPRCGLLAQDAIDGVLRLPLAPAREDHAPPGARKRSHGLEADPAVGAGDDETSRAEVDRVFVAGFGVHLAQWSGCGVAGDLETVVTGPVRRCGPDRSRPEKMLRHRFTGIG